jgi:hypothetical protein
MGGKMSADGKKLTVYGAKMRADGQRKAYIMKNKCTM